MNKINFRFGHQTRAGGWWRGVVALALVVGIWGSAGSVAWAHDGDHDDDAEHARQDLAGTSMATIEKDTRANAKRLAASGKRVSSRTAASVGVAVSTDPGLSGAWSAVVSTQILPVFQAVLPSGKVLMWDSVGDNATESYPNHTFTRAMVWNPTGDTYRRVDVQGYNIFCAGYVQLPDGNVLVVGGNKDSALNGIRQTHLFNWQTETWSRGPDMAAERWYPSVAALANGEALIVAGGSSRAEVYQGNGTLRTLTGFSSFGDRTYPFLVPRLDGRVELVGPGTMNTMDTAGTGALVASRDRDGIFRDYGSFATYAPGKTLVTGGGSVTEGGASQVPTRTAVVVDTSGSGTNVTGTNPMEFPRRQHNLTVLADGSVLATGGQRSSVDGLVDLVNPVFAAELWNPDTGTWSTLASAQKIREYHSTATLLPDGRVLTGGGGICGACVAKGYLEKNLETFTPPYLYRRDGSGALAARPSLSGVPATAAVGSTFSLTSPEAASVAKLALVRLGAPTHSVDQGQRFVPLAFTRSGTTLTATAPANGAVAPPGYYMLFATDTAGVPSVASMVQVTGPTTTPTAGLIRGYQGRCIDIQGGAPTDSTPLIMYRCHGNPNQQWTYAAADGSWRSLGKCMDIAGGAVRSGTRVQLYTCNGTAAQRWTRRSDQTVRPASSTTLCLGVTNGSTAELARLQLQTCNGASWQKWTW